MFPLDAEAVQKQDGQTKNDCEQNASKRLIAHLKDCLPPGLKGPALMDALYPRGPCLKLLKEQELSYLITIKEGYVLLQVEGLEQKGQLQQHAWRDANNLYKAEWAENLIYSRAHQELRVNFFRYQETDNRTGKTLFKSA